MMGDTLLKIDGLRKRYGRLTALDDVSLSAGAGEVVALLGANGAGKTTAFKCILGITGFEGTVEVAGLSPKTNGKEVRRRTGYLPQAPAFPAGDTCREVLRFLAELKGAPADRVDAELARVGLREQAEKQVQHLSGGMRQRLALAAALLSDPPLLLLDEPTANLDVESRRLFLELMAGLKAQGKTILLSTHFLEGLQSLADRVIVLESGRVVLEAGMSDLLNAGGDGRVTVHLNGTSRRRFVKTLEGIGIQPERISAAEGQLEEAVARARAAREAGQREEVR